MIDENLNGASHQSSSSDDKKFKRTLSDSDPFNGFEIKCRPLEPDEVRYEARFCDLYTFQCLSVPYKVYIYIRKMAS